MADVRVLVVDDDFRVAGIHHDLVSARPGFEALPPVRDLASARTAIRDWRPELLLVDVYLPTATASSSPVRAGSTGSC